MTDRILSLLGLCKKGGMLEIGEEPVEAAARARDARVLLLAEDAADNTLRRVRHFAEAGDCLWLRIPYTKEELGRALGRTSCALLAVTDIGFAANLVRRLAERDPVRYDEAAEKLALKEKRAAERRAEQLAHEKNIRTGKVRKKKAEAPAEPEKPLKAAASPRPPRRGAAAAGRPEGGRPRPRDQAPGSRTGGADRKRRSAHPADRFRGSRPVKKGKGSPKKGV
ncbi:L7Ae/L30e/S12e/Gadd45 family ribosomal protein [Dysosmobacter sp.]|uniref:L7Ae/L30e/S12e/Gadd45 family ribosomal protein n=1 Tax=Dysosmobacter sp. TaxID=2591382 RepID=UPI002A9076C9|nr:50S ribosomal protein L7 [Dysosmobacter sp.]MDY3281752.1 50S ribosomal protein L7 [Dysosmobacter sp.]